MLTNVRYLFSSGIPESRLYRGACNWFLFVNHFQQTDLKALSALSALSSDFFQSEFSYVLHLYIKEKKMKQDSHQIQKGSAKAIICLLLIIISYKLLLRIISR